MGFSFRLHCMHRGGVLAIPDPRECVERVRREDDRGVRTLGEPPPNVRNELIETVQVAPREAGAALAWVRVRLDQPCAEIVCYLEHACPGVVVQLQIEGGAPDEALGWNQKVVRNLQSR
jgi:hypothetical protein